MSDKPILREEFQRIASQTEADFKAEKEITAQVLEMSFQSLMKEIAEVLDRTFNPTGEQKAGFALFTFDLDPNSTGKVHYTANCAEEDVLRIVRPVIEEERISRLRKVRRVK